MMQEKRQLSQRRQQMEQSKQQREQAQRKERLEEQYLNNKLTRQFILCANLVLQGSENLSSDTELSYD